MKILWDYTVKKIYRVIHQNFHLYMNTLNILWKGNSRVKHPNLYSE